MNIKKRKYLDFKKLMNKTIISNKKKKIMK